MTGAPLCCSDASSTTTGTNARPSRTTIRTVLVSELPTHTDVGSGDTTRAGGATNGGVVARTARASGGRTIGRSVAVGEGAGDAAASTTIAKQSWALRRFEEVEQQRVENGGLFQLRKMPTALDAFDAR